MDINKTIIMSDKVSGKTREDVVNEVISDVAWGAEVDGSWRLLFPEPRTLRPRPEPGGQELVSYAEHLEKLLPGSGNKKRRMQLLTTFTLPGEPGEVFARHAHRLCAALRNPDGSDVHIITSFFELLLDLKREKRSFTVCFRTFGEDMESVLAEFNGFCEGRHPRYPEVRMDGSDGGPDYRVLSRDPSRCGTFHRQDGVTSLVMGTWEQPGEGKYKDAADRSLSFYKAEIPDTEIIVGLKEVHGYLARRISRSGTLCLRDYHQYWKSKGQTSCGGKVLFLECGRMRAARPHQMFFDDNIRFDDAYIIQPVEVSDPDRKFWVSPLLRTHLCRAIPWESISDAQWFVKQVKRLEAGFERQMRARERLLFFMHMMMTSRYKLAKIRLAREKAACKSVGYDAWKGLRRNDQEISARCHDEDPSS